MKGNLRDLCPIYVGLVDKELKGGNIPVKKGKEYWVVKNVSGKYYGPYKILAECSMKHYGEHVYGFLALVKTCIDPYYCSVTNLDIIDVSEDAVRNRAEGLLEKDKVRKKEARKALRDMFNDLKEY
ncbi:hypothetical protein [Vibrio phage RYC]|nr:hypothetical protein [Vibrio phage RYC]